MAEQFAVNRLARQTIKNVMGIAGKQRNGCKAKGNCQQGHQRTATIARQAAQGQFECIHAITSSLAILPSRNWIFRST